MPSAFNIVPDDYEIITTLDVSGAVHEYIASYKSDKTPVHLRVYSFTDTTDTMMHRHLRNFLRRDVGFMEELNHPNIIKLFDFSETKRQFWIATQPAEVEKLSNSFTNIQSFSVEKRIALVEKSLSTIDHIHNCGIVHRNLSSNGVFLDPDFKLYVGDFGLACYLEDVQTSMHDTKPTSTSGTTYQAPEIKDPKTTFLDVRCDVFSAGLLAVEILCAHHLSRDMPEDFKKTLWQNLEQQGIIEPNRVDAYNVLLKAVATDPAKRWSNIKDFSNVLRIALHKESPDAQTSFDLTETIDVTQTIQTLDEPGVDTLSDTISSTQQQKESLDSKAPVLPSEAENEIWNNRYEIIEKIGGGGQAVVYKALDHLTNEEIAIKTLLSRHKKDKSAINRLKQEAMVARSLTHKYVVRTYSVEQRTDTTDESEAFFICMELIASGLELRDVINRRRAAGRGFELGEVLHISRQLLEALKYAHSYTIHRDIKPGNIMLVPHEGRESGDTSDLTQFDIRLMDFGIAKVLTQKRIEVTGKGFWSAHYGAPELADTNATVDPRADLYSVGVIIYQMLTGNIPRKGSPSANKVNKNVPTALAAVVDKAINADRGKRFKSAAVLIREIEKSVSRFSWIVNAVKVAAGILLVAVVTALILYLIPESDRLQVDQCIKDLKGRSPTQIITSLVDNSNIMLKDLRDFEMYNKLRVVALENLENFADGGVTDFKARYKHWKNQENLWSKIEPQVNQLKQIEINQQKYYNHEDSTIITNLMELEPSSILLSNIKEEVKTAETLLNKRPLSKETLDICDNTHGLASVVFTNVVELSGVLQGRKAAEKVNEKLKDVKKLRTRFLSAQNDLNKIDQFKKADFHEWDNKCLIKADSYFNSFELESAEKYFSLLSQICGTVSDVKEQIDFSSSEISLYVSRLMQLCYENIETFDDMFS